MSKKEILKKDVNNEENSAISRRKAIQKMGYAAFASSTMFLLLNNPTKVYAVSNESPGGVDDGDPGWDNENSTKADPPQNNNDDWNAEWD